ncbi:MAG: hypothetical protein ACJ8C4_12590 [Gemmataceae bacterium]
MSIPWGKMFDPEFVMMFFIFGGGVITGVVALFVNSWRRNRESERTAILKQQMIDKGMSADDIVRVIEAKPRKSEATPTEF